MKCICCKFDNCKKEFNFHRSNTSFSALDRQFGSIAEMIQAHGEGFQDKVCDRHKSCIWAWIDDLYRFADVLRPGVPMTKIIRRP